MTFDAILKVIDLPQNSHNNDGFCVALKNASGDVKPYRLKHSPYTRMNPSAFFDVLQKSLGGIVLADQVSISGESLEVGYLTHLKAKNDLHKHVFTSPITTANIIYYDGTRIRHISTPWELIQETQKRSRISMLATTVKPTPIHCSSSDDVLSVISSVSKTAHQSFTAKCIVVPSDGSPSFEVYQERNLAGGYCATKTLERIKDNSTLSSIFAYGGVNVFPAVSLRLSDTSTNAIIKKWLQIRPGAKHHALERFFALTTDSMQPLYGYGFVAAATGSSNDSGYQYGTNYRMLSDSKPLRAFL